MCGMCGFLFGSCHSNDTVDVEGALSMISHRGPHGQKARWFTPSFFLGFVRLAVVDLSEGGSQPFVVKGSNDSPSMAVTCNGEIYNHVALKDLLGLDENSSDCCVIIPAVSNWGIDEFLKRADGIFAIALCSWSSDSFQLCLCRDRSGVKPLIWGNCPTGGCFGFASEVKGLPASWNVQDVPPGCMIQITQANGEIETNLRRFALPWESYPHEFPVLPSDIRVALTAAVAKQLMGDRPVAVLLSGGVDSSLIAAITARELARKGEQLATFTIHHDDGRSDDLLHARAVADWIGSKHSEVSFSSLEGIAALSKVIQHVETHDVITIRASIPLYLLAKHVSKTHHVVFVGEGADELFGGYSLFSHFDARSVVQFRSEVERRLLLISDSELMRVDRCTMAFGVEARVPFLDSKFVSLVMQKSCDVEKMCHPAYGKIEKFMLRSCFDGWLPDSVLYRRKEQMADGVGRQWIIDLREHAKKVTSISDADKAEAHLFKQLFEATLGAGREKIVKMRSQQRKVSRHTHVLPNLTGSLAIGQWRTVASDPQLSCLISEMDAVNFCLKILGIRLQQPSLPSVSFLNSLIQASLQKIAYHNLTVLVRPRRPPTMQEIREDFLSGLGGPCAVVNAAFAAFLHALGFVVCLIPATIHKPDCHVAMLVLIKGRFHYVDVANGKPYFEAIPLGDDRPRGISNFRWKVEWNVENQRFEVFHGSLVRNSVKWRNSPAISFDPARFVHYSSFHSMIQESRTNRTYGPFLRGLRLALFSIPYEIVSVRDTELTANSTKTLAVNESHLLDFVSVHFSRLIIEMVPEALAILRSQNDHLWKLSKL